MTMHSFLIIAFLCFVTYKVGYWRGLYVAFKTEAFIFSDSIESEIERLQKEDNENDDGGPDE
jgi:hypothetical protein